MSLYTQEETQQIRELAKFYSHELRRKVYDLLDDRKTKIEWDNSPLILRVNAMYDALGMRSDEIADDINREEAKL